MDFGYSEEQEMLRRSAREFLENECPRTHVREMMEDAKGYSPELYRKMAELGWMGLIFPEDCDGMGAGFVDLSVLLEEMGRALLPGPFFASVVLGGLTIANEGTDAQKRRLLPPIANGEAQMTLAYLEASAREDAEGVTLAAKRDGDAFYLTGQKMFVPDAHVSDHMLVAARTANGATPEQGVTMFVVDSRAPGVSITPLRVTDGSKLCDVKFENVRLPVEDLVGVVNEGWPLLNRARVLGMAGLCSSMVGGAQMVMEMSVQYAKDRVQFGRPIGSFQVIKHKCADLLVAVESAKSVAGYAAWAVDHDTKDAPLAASMAKAWCSDAYRFVTREAIQIHGGIGFTWDHDLHLYFKTAKKDEVLFGDADYHRELVAQMLDM